MNKESKKTLNILSKLAKAKYGNRNLVKMSVVIKEYEESPLDYMFGMTGFKDSRHRQEVKISPEGEEYVVDVELPDYPWNLEE